MKEHWVQEFDKIIKIPTTYIKCSVCGIWKPFFEYCPKDDIKTNILKKDFIVAALNEKWERDFGEPLRWTLRDAPVISDEIITALCLKCAWSWGKVSYNYCPSCRVRLLPPGEEKQL